MIDIELIKLLNKIGVIIEEPVGFGWARNNHFTSVLHIKDARTDVIIKKSWTTNEFKVEKEMYLNVLSQVGICAPILLGSNDPWIILNNCGINVSFDNKDIYRDSLKILGTLHKNGFNVDKTKITLPILFSYENKAKALLLFEKVNDLNIDSELLLVFNKVWDELANHKQTIIHGDFNESNVISKNGKLFLIDFERSCIGSPAVDLGKISKITNDLESYCTASELGYDNVLQMIEYGRVWEAYSCILRMLEYRSNPPNDNFIFDKNRVNEELSYIKSCSSNITLNKMRI